MFAFFYYLNYCEFLIQLLSVKIKKKNEIRNLFNSYLPSYVPI